MNTEIRNLISRYRLRHYEIAKQVGISPFTLSVWLRNELSPERREKVESAIKEVTRRISAHV